MRVSAPVGTNACLSTSLGYVNLGGFLCTFDVEVVGSPSGEGSGVGIAGRAVMTICRVFISGAVYIIRTQISPNAWIYAHRGITCCLYSTGEGEAPNS